MPVLGKEEHDRDMAAKAAATQPADLAPFELPERFDDEDRVGFARGVTAFRQGDFYLAHDLWEEVWRGYRLRDRLFLQAFIHVAVGSYHAECDNPVGARSQFNKAIAKLTPFAPHHWGVGVFEWIELVAAARDQQTGTPEMNDLLRALREAL
jgi:predicted metal-dependent hydrolase